MNYLDLYMISEAAETLAADVNEILVGYYGLGGTWKGFEGAGDAKKQLAVRKDQIGEEAYNIQDERAQAMVKEISKWAKANNFKGKVVKAWWTARPGILSKAVGVPVDSRKNPTDTLFKYNDDKFLGISAKSSKGSTEIGFKNPGLGTIDKELKINNASMAKDAQAKVIAKLDLPKSTKDRKAFLRANTDVRAKTIKAGLDIMEKIRDTTIARMQSLSQEDIRIYILNSWMDAGDENYPAYIKVTGRYGGGKKPASADIVDPVSNPKLDALVSLPIKLTPLGIDSIGVEAKGKRLMKGRVKWESEKIASSLKFSVEGWK
jgi:hypothetical protein